MTKMNPEVKAKWLAALRSGEYKQTTNKLHDASGEMCCLGVLCDLSGLHEWKPKTLNDGTGLFAYDDRDSLPPDDVGAWAGFEQSQYGYRTPKVTIYGEHTDIDSHNDEGRTFAQIADAIEAQL